MAKNVYCDERHPGVQLGTRVPEKLKRALKVASLERGQTISDVVCEALCAELGLERSLFIGDGVGAREDVVDDGR